MKKELTTALMCTLCIAVFARAPWKSGVPDGELKWIDGSALPIEGRGFVPTDPADTYVRLPAAVRAAPDLAKIKGMAQSATGINFRFKTDSDLIRIRWSLPNDPPYGWSVATGLASSGVDVYSWFSEHGWRFWLNDFPRARTNTLDVMWVPGRACTIYLPMFNRIESFSIGIKEGASIGKARPHALGKPVLVLRGTTERPEAVEAGTVLLVGTEEERVYSEAKKLLTDETAYARMAEARSPYGDGEAARRIVEAILYRYGKRKTPPVPFA